MVDVDDAAAVHRHDLDQGADLLGHQLPGNDVRVVLECGEQDFIAALQPVARVRLRHQVDRLRSATREDDFARRRCVDEAAHFLARFLEKIGGFLAQLVHAAMHVGVRIGLVAIDRRDHARGSLRRGGAVEVHQRLAVHLAAQDGEIAPHALRVVTIHRGEIRVHGLPNNPSSAETSLSCTAISASISARSSVSSMRDTASSMKAHCNSVCAVRRSMPRDNR